MQSMDFLQKLIPFWGKTDLVLYLLWIIHCCHTVAKLLALSHTEQGYLSSCLDKGFSKSAQVFTEGGFPPERAVRWWHLLAKVLMLLENCFLPLSMCITYICCESLQNTAICCLPAGSLLLLSCVSHSGMPPCPANI